MYRLAALLLLLVGLAELPVAQAQEAELRPGDVYLTPGLMVLGRDRGRDISSLAAPSLGLGLQHTERFAWELHAAHGETSVRNGGPDVDVTMFRLDGLYELGGDAWQRYVVGGVTRTRYQVSGAPNDKGTGASLGLGLRRALTDRLSLQLDGRGYFDFDEKKWQPGATLGLRYVLSRQEPAPSRPSTPPPAREERAPEPAAAAPEPAPAPEPEPVAVQRLEVIIEFDFDSSALRSQHRGDLQRIVRFMREHEDAVARLEGHTDSRGSEAYNQRLSERRAAAVRDHLVEAGIAAARIRTVGYGEARPAASNETDEGRQRNRRVVAIAVEDGAER